MNNPAEVIIDESNPRNLINLVPAKLKHLIQEIYEEHPDYMNMSEHELRKRLDPDDRTEMMRLSFWQEYDRAQMEGLKMKLDNVFAGIMPSGNFYRDFLTNKDRVAWMLCPVAEHLKSLGAALDYGKHSVGKILRMNLFNDDGSIKVKEANIFIKMYELVETRVLGAIIQRIDQRTMVAKVQQEDTQARIDTLRDAEMLNAGGEE